MSTALYERPDEVRGLGMPRTREKGEKRGKKGDWEGVEVAGSSVAAFTLHCGGGKEKKGGKKKKKKGRKKRERIASTTVAVGRLPRFPLLSEVVLGQHHHHHSWAGRGPQQKRGEKGGDVEYHDSSFQGE